MRRPLATGYPITNEFRGEILPEENSISSVSVVVTPKHMAYDRDFTGPSLDISFIRMKHNSETLIVSGNGSTSNSQTIRVDIGPVQSTSESFHSEKNHSDSSCAVAVLTLVSKSGFCKLRVNHGALPVFADFSVDLANEALRTADENTTLPAMSVTPDANPGRVATSSTNRFFTNIMNNIQSLTRTPLLKFNEAVEPSVSGL